MSRVAALGVVDTSHKFDVVVAEDIRGSLHLAVKRQHSTLRRNACNTYIQGLDGKCFGYGAGVIALATDYDGSVGAYIYIVGV